MKNHQNAAFPTKMKKLLVLVLTLAMVLTTINFSTASAASKPTLSKSSVTLLTGDKTTLKVKNKIQDASYTWKTSDKAIATVSSEGVVKAKSKGTATISCKVKASSTTYTLKCKVTVLKGAVVVRINNKAKAKNMKVGEEYNLNRTLYPKSSNDKTYWTSSDPTIANPNKKGKFTALRTGVVTITATTKSGATDSVKIQVYGGEATVGSQAELIAALNSYVADIKIVTDAAVEFTVPEGDYSYQTLTVDAPNADVTNNGTFAAITINQIKADTWYENALHNVLTINSMNSRVVVAENADATINVEKDGAHLALVNNGTLTAVNVDSKASVNISGTSTQVVPVSCTVAGSTITSNVPLDITCTERITLVLNAGTEGTVIHVASEDLIPTVQGTVAITVVVGTGENTTTITVKPSTSTSDTGSGSTPTTPDEPVVTISLSGVVTTVSGSAVSGAAIRLAKYDGTEGNYYQAVVNAGTSNFIAVADRDGKYSFSNLSAGHYVVLAIAEGYAANVSTVEITAGTLSKKDITLAALVDGQTSTGTVAGTIYEAITNQPVVVSGGSFTLVTSDGHVAVVSGSSYTFENLPEGTYTVTITDERTNINESNRFVPTQFSIFSLGGATISGQNCYLSNSAKAGTATIVLTWGQYPRDLDSHLVGKDAAGQTHHIAYYDQTANITVERASSVSGSAYDIYANEYDLRLDVDDITSYGPETTSIYRCNNEDPWFKFYVHNFSGNEGGTLFESNAQVVVTTSNSTRTFSISETTGGTTERVWYVCDLNALTGEIKAVNQLLADDYCIQ